MSFVRSDRSGDVQLLTAIYDFERRAIDSGWGSLAGLDLLDLEPYGGTILCNPRFTPTNSITFATTGGDDVHFGLVEWNGKRCCSLASEDDRLCGRRATAWV